MKNFRSFKFFVSFLSCFSMVLTPLANAQQSERIQKEKIQKYLAEFGLNGPISLNEFWSKAKYYFPEGVQKQISGAVLKNKDMAMPEVELTSAKGTDGTNIPVLRLSHHGKSYTVQIFGEEKNWMRVAGLNLTKLDMQRPQDALKRLIASDYNINLEAQKYKQEVLERAKAKPGSAKAISQQMEKDFGRFEGFPRINPILWKSLTPQQRAAYFVNMRLMRESAQIVLETFQAESASSASSERRRSKNAIEQFIKIIQGEDAGAKTAPIAALASMSLQKGSTVRTRKGEVVRIPYDAKSCVVAGYIGAYTKVDNVNGKDRFGCSADVAIAAFSKPAAGHSADASSKPEETNPFKFITDANETCIKKNTTNFVACNPVIYGFPGGEPACIDKNSTAFQHATHYSSPDGADTCDTQSRLSSSDKVISFDPKNYRNIEPRDKQLAALHEDQKKEQFKLTKSFLEGVLKRGDSERVKTGQSQLLDLFKGGKWNQDLDNELVRIQAQFEEEIERATKTCVRDYESGSHEKNQKLACDQLHRRWLFTEREIAKFRDLGCVRPAMYIGKYEDEESSVGEPAKEKTKLNKSQIDGGTKRICKCPDPNEPLKLIGEACPLAPVPAIPPVSPPKCGEGLTEVKDDTGNLVACSCPKNSALQAQPGEPLNCDPANPPEPQPVCPYTDVKGDFDLAKCKCANGNEPRKEKNQTTCEEDLTPWLIAGVLVLIGGAIYFRDNNPKQPPTVPNQCNAGMVRNAHGECVCPSVCQPGFERSPAGSCSCAPIVGPPRCEPPKQPVGNDCLCPTSASCTAPQRIYNHLTCECTPRPQPVTCPNGSVPPEGKLELCPKCKNGTYIPAGGCPSEGGGGRNRCYDSTGREIPCNGGGPTGTGN